MASHPADSKHSAELNNSTQAEPNSVVASGSSESDSDTRDEVEDIDGDYGSYRDHIFNDPEKVKYWTNVMHNANYEGRHRFDPDMTWSAAEEKKLKRSVSILPCPTI